MGQSQSQNNYKTTPVRKKPNPDDYKYYVEWEGAKFAEKILFAMLSRVIG